MRTGWRLFPTQEKGGGRKPQSPERKHNCQDVRARPLDRNCRIFQRKSCSQKGVGMRHVYVIGQGLHLTSPHGTPLASRDCPGPSPRATGRDALTVMSLGFCQQNSSFGTLLPSTSPAPGRPSYVPPAPTSRGECANSCRDLARPWVSGPLMNSAVLLLSPGACADGRPRTGGLQALTSDATLTMTLLQSFMQQNPLAWDPE
ncbi:PREDICTED: uncharacterized protein LOC109374222 isoform X1 [Hipposideros armiger]|uniref:Uncharacterized protein LOC109374222 isoform X1 n=1 Tax=Hipposideros armiger TaxID=186990 RepID=A0A8B7Q6X9_HIPAR|nr:PREDICTED: uncharacterized protein LOC109374222 isoform X1 [Hipposideros armiger]